jgi:phage terminase small subunit
LVEQGLLTSVDLGPFAAYCQACGRVEQASRLFAETGGSDNPGRAGGEIVNPLLRIARDAANKALRYAAEFGLTPVLRSRLGSTRSLPSKFDGLLG